jgi:hypothetical protein
VAYFKPVSTGYTSASFKKIIKDILFKVQEPNVWHSRIILCMEVTENNATSTVMARTLF